MVNAPDNFTELKRLFDAEVERIKENTAKIPAHLGGGEHRAPAITFVKLLDGCSLQECNQILRSASSIIGSVNSKNFKINAVEVEDVL